MLSNQNDKKTKVRYLFSDGGTTKEIIEHYDESKSNPRELILKNVTLYEPIKNVKEINKIRYKNLKIEALKNELKCAIDSLKRCIDLYKELYNRTELWERKSTLDFNFEDWNTLKKTKGRFTRYYNDVLKILKDISYEE